MCWLATPRTITVCRRPWPRVITISSPGRTTRFGRAASPLTSTLPPRQARCASDRVLKRQATSSQTSIRSPVPPGSIMRSLDPSSARAAALALRGKRAQRPGRPPWRGLGVGLQAVEVGELDRTAGALAEQLALGREDGIAGQIATRPFLLAKVASGEEVACRRARSAHRFQAHQRVVGVRDERHACPERDLALPDESAAAAP